MIGTFLSIVNVTGALTSEEDGTTKRDGVPTVISGHPFSAIKYERIVRVQSDGRRATIREAHHILLARDARGVIFMSGADRSDSNCDLPQLGHLEICDFWSTILFDPTTATMWHWPEGEVADKTQATQMDLDYKQLSEAEGLTSIISLPKNNSQDEEGRQIEDLGERLFAGLRVRGVRTTELHGGSSGEKPRELVHEVWFSEDYRLVVQVVDGNPEGEERVAGLSHLTISPSASLFEIPPNRTVRHWKDSGQYAGVDIDLLSLWQVQ